MEITTESFTRIGWQGFLLLVPEEWNLRLHEGNAGRGALVFADLRRPRLEVRWRPPRRGLLGRRFPADEFAKTLHALRRRNRGATVEAIAPHAAIIRLDQGTLLLASDQHRLYELYWPAGDQNVENYVNAITPDFLHHLQNPASKDTVLWSVYGATGQLPASAKLDKVSLLPGATSLTFKNRGSLIALGSFSMAERLLAQAGSLRQWATRSFPVIATHPMGEWNESPDQATFTAATRRLFRHYRHKLSFLHDRSSNRIVWTHHLFPDSG